MATTITNPEITRYIRRWISSQITNTAWLGAMQVGADGIKTAVWDASEADLSAITNPVNSPATVDFSDERFDAYKQSGNAQTGTGTQKAFLGMACHTIAIPAEAADTYVTKIRFIAAADKFCVGGLKVAAILSNTATPPALWDLCRQGGTDSGVDASGSFATEDQTDSLGNPVGILAETEPLLSGSSNKSGEFELDLSGVATAYNYLHLVISLYDYTTHRREYWIEGAGYIDPLSLQITFSGDFEPGPPDDAGMVLPFVTAVTGSARNIRAINLRQDYPQGGTYTGISADNMYLLKKSAVARFRFGSFSSMSTLPDAGLATMNVLSALVTVTNINSSGPDFVFVRGSGSEAVLCTVPNLAGQHLWLKTTAASTGASLLRVSLLNSNWDDLQGGDSANPNYSSPGLWTGLHEDIIGTKTFTGLSAGQVVGVPVHSDAGKKNLFILVSVDNYDQSDAAQSGVVGFPTASGGFSILNAHISKRYYPA